MQHQYTPRAKPTEFLEMNCGGPQALRAGKQFAKVLCNRRSLSAAQPATSSQVLNLGTASCNRAQVDISDYTCIYIVICFKVVTYLSALLRVELKNTLSRNFEKSGINTYAWNFGMYNALSER